MHLQLLAFTFLSAISLVFAVPIRKRAVCSSYTLLNTRGTTEPQGESIAFRIMNTRILSQVPGGEIYNTVYPAGLDQNSASGTQDILNHISSTLQNSPSTCFILQGYSQGAAATVDALPYLNGAAFDAVVGVFLVGDPLHKAGLECNVDNFGGDSTRNVDGLEIAVENGKGVPGTWVGKVRDVCIYGDGVCDTKHGIGITAQHLQYSVDGPTQDLGTAFAVGMLQGGT